MKWDHALINGSSVVSEWERKGKKNSLKHKSLSLSHKVATWKLENSWVCSAVSE
jgi:hypothetical protein